MLQHSGILRISLLSRLFLAFIPVALMSRVETVESDRKEGADRSDSMAKTDSSGFHVAGSSDVTVGRVATAGQTLHNGRYVLTEFIEQSTLDPFTDFDQGAYLRADNFQPKVDFPRSAMTSQEIEQFRSEATHLGYGSFGDVWQAYDHFEKQLVAVKIFYSKSRTGGDYLTWNSATETEQTALQNAADECVVAQKVYEAGAAYPQGARRICRCFDEHVLNKKGTSFVLFLVMELCGDRNMKDVRTELILKNSMLTSRKAVARRTSLEVLQAIALMQKTGPGLIHHDLKLENVLYSGGTNMKVIDFGCSVWATGTIQPSNGDPFYKPPERTIKKAYEKPLWSFDVYGVGLMHLELICPKMKHIVYAVDNGAFSMSKLLNNVNTNVIDCPDVGKDFKAAAKDLHFIEQCTQFDPKLRPRPEDAIANFDIFIGLDKM